TRAVRRKRLSSIVAGIDLVKRDKAAAFVSAGSTGAVVSAAILNLGKAKGVPRPALAVLFPTMAGPALVLDVGANSDCKPHFLAGFANLGHNYAAHALRIPNPRVALLSNGEEALKGNKLVRQAHKMLQGSKLNFVGNVEGKDIVRGAADVVITDGFTGNAVLKAIEGFSELIFFMLRSSLDGKGPSSDSGSSSSLAFKAAVADMTRRLDWSEYGGAVLLGVKGNVVVAHGRSGAKAMTNAIRMARLAADNLSAVS
ncbi:MAG: phosphate acyltransferase PlsX, partial [Chloroflexi bacterium]|nr:phosphate acyltransferase PlsX [Chloroflexota bacterium]